MTIFNERTSIQRFFEDLNNFTRLPDELVIVDGGSNDGTVELVTDRINNCAVPVKFIQDKCNIARGRNIAIRNATFELIAITDMGCVIANDWLERIVAPFEADPAVEIVGGYYGHLCETPIQYCFSHLHVKTHLTQRNFLPSSRSLALRRHVWTAVGGYPEHMTVGEDTYFDLRIREKGFKEVVAPEAKVYWEAANSYRGLYRKYFRYARSAGMAFQQPHHYVFTVVNYVLFLIGLGLAFGVSPVWWPAALAHFAVYSYLRIFRRKAVWTHLSLGNLLRYYGIVFTQDMAGIFGFLAGLLQYLAGKSEAPTTPV